MRTVVIESVQAYPAWQAEMALAATARQLARVSTGEGVLNSIWHTYWAIEKFTPRAAPGMHAARQQHGEIGFGVINDVHLPVALASMLLLIPLIGWGLTREPFEDFGRLGTTVALALLANALVCGVFANPHDRYGARLVWLVPLVVLLAAWRAVERRRTLALAPPPELAPGTTTT
jgi:hypothetical protein